MLLTPDLNHPSIVQLSLEYRLLRRSAPEVCSRVLLQRRYTSSAPLAKALSNRLVTMGRSTFVAARRKIETLRPALQRVYMKRVYGYRYALKSFIVGIRIPIIKLDLYVVVAGNSDDVLRTYVLKRHREDYSVDTSSGNNYFHS
ncbi:hypothetical protein Tco_1416396 [Tanacetum coccineum]